MVSQLLLQGRVADASGAPPAGTIHVHRFSLRAGSRVVRLKAESDGTFELPIGIPAIVLASSTLGGAAASPATGYEPSYTLRLQPRIEIHGRVLHPNGAPAAGARIAQVFVMRFADKLVFATPPNDRGRVQKRGKNVFLAPCFCLSSVATTDGDGLFRLFTLPPLDGKVLLRLESPYDGSFWVSATDYFEIVLRGEKDPSLRLPDGSAVDDLPLEPIDPAIQQEPLPPVTDPVELRRLWIRNIRDTSGSLSPDLLPELEEALNEADDEVRSIALQQLARLSRTPSCRKRVVERLRRVAEEGDSCVDISLAAAGTLVELGERTDAAPFYDALRRDDADERLAVRALATLLRRDAIELILARMEKSKHGPDLGAALETLTGARHGDQLALWQAWLEANRTLLPRQASTADTPSFPRAQERYRRKDARGARADLDATLRRDGPSAPALALRARIRMEQGDLDGALRDADQSMRLNPREESVLSLRSEIVARQRSL